MPKPNFIKKPISKIMDESIDKLPNRKAKTEEELQAQGCLYSRNCKYPKCDCYAESATDEDIVFGPENN